MSGQASVAFEQQPTVESIELGDEQSPNEPSNPIAAFLEKHGSSLVQNHEGQTVTVADAMANCPPFARLVSVMGEAALNLAAPRSVEEETEKKEDSEEQDNTINTNSRKRYVNSQH
jgi:hypothetical protein